MSSSISMSPYAQMVYGGAPASSITTDVVGDVSRALADLNARTGAVLGRLATSQGSVGMPAMSFNAPAPASSSVTGMNALALAGVLGIAAGVAGAGGSSSSSKSSTEKPSTDEKSTTGEPKPPPGGSDVPVPPTKVPPPPPTTATPTTGSDASPPTPKDPPSPPPVESYSGIFGYLTPQAKTPDPLEIPASK